ncbi:RadC family protein [Vagococcus jeotgali]|uniref:RadC family protein n=1 Tax=Vagococcus jeotgali TaxID=3109030 RepID=UPI002DD90DEC|nr:DNA repair protein RadC [Vagococcus sp. B2T-5]
MKNTSQELLLIDHYKPRERLVNLGADSLSNEELLAIILQSGYKSMPVLELSQQVLEECDGLYGLKNAHVEELVNIKGIGEAKAIQLKATVELGKRLAGISQKKFGNISSSLSLGHQLIEEMRGMTQEHFVVLYLDVKYQIIRKETIFIGTLSQSIAHPREIFHLAVRLSAFRIILVHNHPSGDPTPSPQDLEFTKRMVDCGKLMGIDVLDHLVIGENTYVSFKEESLL